MSVSWVIAVYDLFTLGRQTGEANEATEARLISEIQPKTTAEKKAA